MPPAARAFSWYLAGTGSWFGSSGMQGSAELSLVSLGFWGGTIGSTLAQIRLGALRRPGRAIVMALLLGAVVLAAMAWPGPFPAFVVLCLIWALGTGVVLTQARTLVQAAAPETHRARIRSSSSA